MFIITRAAVIDRIEGVLDAEESGAYKIVFQDDSFATINSGSQLEQLAICFGATVGAGDLQEKLRGQKVVYCMTMQRELRGFTPYNEWEGVEFGEGDFMIDKDGGCSGYH